MRSTQSRQSANETLQFAQQDEENWPDHGAPCYVALR